MIFYLLGPILFVIGFPGFMLTPHTRPKQATVFGILLTIGVVVSMIGMVHSAQIDMREKAEFNYKQGVRAAELKIPITDCPYNNETDILNWMKGHAGIPLDATPAE